MKTLFAWLFVIILLQEIVYSQSYIDKYNLSEAYHLDGCVPLSLLPQSFKNNFWEDSIEVVKFGNRRNFLNNNLYFYDFNNSFESSLIITGEVATGGLIGYGAGKLMHNLFKPKQVDGNFVGIAFQAIFVWTAAIAGSSTGVYLFGKFFRDEGNYKNMIIWMAISVTVLEAVAKIISNDNDKQFWITSAGLPIGATIGFNSNNLWEILSLEL